MRKTCRPLRPNLCALPCYPNPAKYAFIVIFIYDILLSLIMLFLACNSFFFLQWNQVENFKPRVLSPISKPQSSAVFIWMKREIWFVTRWMEQFYWVCLLSALCSFMSVTLSTQNRPQRPACFPHWQNIKMTVTGSKNRKSGPPWPGGQSLSCHCLSKSKNCVGPRGDW